MAERTLDHLDQATLAALGRGMLDGDEMAAVETHLAVCESCCEVLTSLPDDEFVASLRTARSRSNPTTGIWHTIKPNARPSETCDVPDFTDQPSFETRDDAFSSEWEPTLPAGDSNDTEKDERLR